MDIKMIFFDLDDTLHDHQKPFKDAFRKSLPNFTEKVVIEAVYKKFRESSDYLWDFYSKNQLTLEELRIQRIIKAMESFQLDITREQAGHFQTTYEYCLEKLELFPSVPELFSILKNKGYRLGIITNGPVNHQLNKIKSLGLLNLINEKHVFVSDAIGVAKPNPEIFEYVAHRVMFSPNELLYVGDSWNNDVVAPYRAGWHSVWYNHRKRQPESDLKPLAIIDCLIALSKLF